MKPVHRLVLIVVPVIALAACAAPTAPSFENSCPSGKVPYASCNRNGLRPDYVDPVGDYVDPVGRDTTRKG